MIIRDGTHRFYLGRVGSGVVILILMMGGLLLSAIFIGIPMLMVGGIWLFIDLFLIPGMISADVQKMRNAEIAKVNIAKN